MLAGEGKKQGFGMRKPDDEAAGSRGSGIVATTKRWPRTRSKAMRPYRGEFDQRGSPGQHPGIACSGRTPAELYAAIRSVGSPGKHSAALAGQDFQS